MNSSRYWCFTLLVLVVLTGCGGSAPTLTLRHNVKRPALLRLDSIEAIIVGNVQNENKSFPYLTRLRSKIRENFSHHTAYPILEADNDKLHNVITIMTNVEGMTYTERYDTTYVAESLVPGTVSPPKITKKEEKTITVHCRLLHPQKQGILAVKTFTKNIVKHYADTRKWEQLEEEATDDIAKTIVGWIAPHEETLEFSLLEDNSAAYLTASNTQVLEKKYGQALEILQKTTDTVQFNTAYHKAWYNMGCLYVIMNNYPQAQKAFERASNLMINEQLYADKLTLITQLLKEQQTPKQ